MSWASAQRRSRSPRGRATTDDGSTLTVLKTQGGANVPILSLGQASRFLEHASWMLQSAMGCWGKADALFEYVDDGDILRETRKRGLSDDEVRVVRLKDKSRRHIRAVSLSDKRSVMVAIIVALAIDDEDSVRHLYGELKDYKLDGEFVQLLETALGPAADGDGAEDVESGGAGGSWEHDRGGSQQRDDWCEWQPEEGWSGRWGRQAGDEEWAGEGDYSAGGGGSSGAGRRSREAGDGGAGWRSPPRLSEGPAREGTSERPGRRPASPPPPSPSPEGGAGQEGIELDIIHSAGGQIIPVLGLDKISVFHENASRLLQLATGTTGKADAVYEYTSDKEISSWCFQKGLSDLEVSIVRLKARNLRHVMAVGTSAKRSLMLSLVVAMILNQEVALEKLVSGLKDYDRSLERPLGHLARAAARLAKKRRAP